MSEASMDDDLLQRLLDGEVSDEERAAAEAAMTADPDGRARAARYRRLGAAVRGGVDASLGEPLTRGESDALFARIAGEITKTAKEAPRPALRAIDGGRRGPAPADRGDTPRGASGTSPGATIASVIAIAAAISLAVYAGVRPHGPGPAPGPEDFGPVAVGDPGPAGTHVLEVDFGENTGTVFEVEGDEGEPLAVVVWIDDPAPLAPPGEGG